MTSQATQVAKGVALGLTGVFAIVGFVAVFLVPQDTRTQSEKLGDCISRTTSAMRQENEAQKKIAEEQADRYCAEFRRTEPT